jgi:hypothetical protein
MNAPSTLRVKCTLQGIDVTDRQAINIDMQRWKTSLRLMTTKRVHTRLAHVDELASSRPGMFRESGVRLLCGLV